MMANHGSGYIWAGPHPHGTALGSFGKRPRCHHGDAALSKCDLTTSRTYPRAAIQTGACCLLWCVVRLPGFCVICFAFPHAKAAPGVSGVVSTKTNGRRAVSCSPPARLGHSSASSGPLCVASCVPLVRAALPRRSATPAPARAWRMRSRKLRQCSSTSSADARCTTSPSQRPRHCLAGRQKASSVPDGFVSALWIRVLR